jgi:hypothetical protein
VIWQYGYLKDNPSTQGYIDTKDAVTFIGPVFIAHAPLRSEKWSLVAGVGLGYLDYVDKTTLTSHTYNYRLSGSTLGRYGSMEIDYRFAKHWGVGCRVSTITGVVNRFSEDDNGKKQTIEMDYKNGEGLGQINLSLGLRYYLY